MVRKQVVCRCPAPQSRRRQKPKTRKLEESSGLAQALSDMMWSISSQMKAGDFYPPKWNSLLALKLIVNEADDPDNTRIYYENRYGKRFIIVGDIPSLAMKAGTDFDRDGMRSQLLGLATRYDGVYVNTTHDLNSATINVSDLMAQMRGVQD